MKIKEYNNNELLLKKYVVLSFDLEDGNYLIVSLHNDKEKAKKRYNYLIERKNKLMARTNGTNPVDYFIKETIEIISNERKPFNLI